MSKNNISTSLILSTYNRPDALKLCLLSIAKQRVLPAEVVIGDDGSLPETRNLIEKMRVDYPIPIVHVWQKDDGFRLAMSRNKCVAAAKGDYIIEIDGDLILHRDFVSDHISFARPGYFMKGGRVNLDERLTDKLCKSGEYRQFGFFSKGLLRRVNSIHNLALSNYFLLRYKKNRIEGLGCNMSFWRKDYIHINGYDEFFVGWGGEDYDFAFRMLNSGIKKGYLKFSGIVYHLWHDDKHMQNREKNFDYYHDSVKRKRLRIENGVDKYLDGKFGDDTKIHR